MCAMITADTSQMTDFEPSEPGTYRAKILKAEPVISKGGPNKPKVNGVQPTFEFTAPRLVPNKEGEKEIRTITRRSWLPIEGKGTFGFDQLLRCVGLEELADSIKNQPGFAFDTDVLTDRECNVVVITDLYTPANSTQARQQDSIQSFLPL